MSVDPIAVDIVVEETPIFVDAVLGSPVEAVDVTMPDTGPIAVDAVVLSQIEVVDVSMSSMEAVAVEAWLGGGPIATNGTCGSVTPISPGTTAYIGIGWSVVEAKAEFLVMVPGTVTDFAVTLGGVDLGSGSVVVTMRRNGADTPLTVTLFGTDPSEYVMGAVAFEKGDRASIKAVLTEDVAANVIITPTWRLVPT